MYLCIISGYHEPEKCDLILIPTLTNLRGTLKDDRYQIFIYIGLGGKLK